MRANTILTVFFQYENSPLLSETFPNVLQSDEKLFRVCEVETKKQHFNIACCDIKMKYFKIKQSSGVSIDCLGVRFVIFIHCLVLHQLNNILWCSVQFIIQYYTFLYRYKPYNVVEDLTVVLCRDCCGSTVTFTTMPG